MKCAACENPDAKPSAAIPKLCVTCWANLPMRTRVLYETGQMKINEVRRELARDHRAR